MILQTFGGLEATVAKLAGALWRSSFHASFLPSTATKERICQSYSMRTDRFGVTVTTHNCRYQKNCDLVQLEGKKCNVSWNSSLSSQIERGHIFFDIYKDMRKECQCQIQVHANSGQILRKKTNPQHFQFIPQHFHVTSKSAVFKRKAVFSLRLEPPFFEAIRKLANGKCKGCACDIKWQGSVSNRGICLQNPKFRATFSVRPSQAFWVAPCHPKKISIFDTP